MSNPVTERVDRSVGAELQSAIASRLESWTDARVAARLWQKDGSLWAASGKQPDELAAWLGWLDLPTSMRDRLPELARLADEVRRDGYTRAAVLGMGGSSLAPELFSRVFGFGAGAAAPGATASSCASWTRPIRPRCADSASGPPPHARSSASAPSPAPRPSRTPSMPPWRPRRPRWTSSPSPIRARHSSTWRAARSSAPSLTTPPDVGGRYSALTVFGLLPALLHGVDLDVLLQRAAAMAQRCHEAPADNPACGWAPYLGEAALAGRDKLTVLTSPRLASFGDWVEQLIAESTGKQGTGIVPVVGEPIADPSATPTTAVSCWSPWPTIPTPSGGASPRRSSGVATRSCTSSSPMRWTSVASSSAGRSRPPRPG